MKFLSKLKRLREPSTWASIGVIGAMLGPQAEAVIGAAGSTAVSAGALVAAILGIVRSERDERLDKGD
ncbi:MAG: hypothetical protein AAFQ04_08680, partial [Pseudomonadota bacterium]